jgi:hypothetical protein
MKGVLQISVSPCSYSCCRFMLKLCYYSALRTRFSLSIQRKKIKKVDQGYSERQEQRRSQELDTPKGPFFCSFLTSSFHSKASIAKRFQLLEATKYIPFEKSTFAVVRPSTLHCFTMAPVLRSAATRIEDPPENV